MPRLRHIVPHFILFEAVLYWPMFIWKVDALGLPTTIFFFWIIFGFILLPGAAFCHWLIMFLRRRELAAPVG